MILSEVFCANLGGAATMCGDPPNIIIGTSLGLTFFDFLTNTGVVMLICLVATVVYFYFCFRRILRESESQRPTDITYPDAASAITDRRAFIACGAVFLLVVVLLVTHAQTELTVATIGCIAAVLMALATPAPPEAMRQRGCSPRWTTARCCSSSACSWWSAVWRTPAVWMCWPAGSAASAADTPL